MDSIKVKFEKGDFVITKIPLPILRKGQVMEVVPIGATAIVTEIMLAGSFPENKRIILNVLRPRVFAGKCLYADSDDIEKQSFIVFER
jgi:hypothetical protein